MPVFDGVGPGLYRENAFRITGLAVDATPRDIRRSAERLRVMEKVGLAASPGPSVLPPPRPPDETVVQRAMQRLRDPGARLVDELFWFWPAPNGTPDDAMAALRGGDLDAAEREWSRLRPAAEHGDADDGPGGMGGLLAALRGGDTPSSPDALAGAVAVHNLAVLAHTRALDADELDDGSRDQWERALAHWRDAHATDAVWELLEERVRRIDDPRLTPATVREMRAALPTTLLSINAGLAVRAYHDDRTDDAAEHVALMRGSGFDGALIDDALRGAVEPDLARLRAMCDDAERAADADPATGDQAATRLLDRSAPLLTMLAFAFPERHPVLQGAADDVALKVLRCVVPFVTETGRWDAGVDLLERAVPLAATPATKDRIRENLDRARDQLQYLTCQFCEQNPADDACAYEQKLYGEVEPSVVGWADGGPQIQVTWRTATVRVPRCASCMAAHAPKSPTAPRLGCAGTLLILALSIPAFAAAGPGLGFGVIGIGLIGGFFTLAASGSQGGVPQQPVQAFEPVRYLIAQGWRLGERPPNLG
ncbi:hypothetical protein AB0K60_10235 [Thermopolyspora sp. NPDC052614]|uniref:hypothetical protein n=1 Tax=Thermopolyspora sp. NPDC052614 TaxID=3155682 RepID=UPI003418832E